MPASADKTLERITSVAVILVAVALLALIAQREWPRAKPAANNSPRDFLGKQVKLADLGHYPAKLNLVLGLSTTCHFCAENADFYRTLSSLRRPQQAALFTVFPEPKPEAQTYVEQKQIEPDAVISEPLSELDISGTPTLLLLDSGGVVKKAWIGMLDRKAQDDVLRQLR